MTIEEAVLNRHSVRRYQDAPLPEPVRSALEDEIGKVNEESGLHIQLVCDRPEAFATLMNRYGWFAGVRHYMALVGPDDGKLDEACGYYGEHLALYAETLGLGSCWVGGTFSRKKTAYEAGAGERLALIIAVGVPSVPGKPHKSRSYAAVTRNGENAPDWFRKGAEAALLAPTAVNQQRFLLEYEAPDRVRATAGRGSFTKVDLGIVKYHFEIGAGKENFSWAES